MAKIIFTGDETFLDGSRAPAWYVVPPIYGRVGEYFRTRTDAIAYVAANGWELKI